MAELSHDMNGMQTHAALTKMFPDHKDILKGWDTRIDVSVAVAHLDSWDKKIEPMCGLAGTDDETIMMSMRIKAAFQRFNQNCVGRSTTSGAFRRKKKAQRIERHTTNDEEVDRTAGVPKVDSDSFSSFFSRKDSRRTNGEVR